MILKYVIACFSIVLISCSSSSMGNSISTFDDAEVLREKAINTNNIQKQLELYNQLTPVYEKLAEDNNSEAQFILGDIYGKGLNGNVDLKKSFFWTKRAADNGNILAIYNTAMNYYLGRGVNKNIDKAKEYYLKAANKDDTDAQYSLGKILIDENNKEGIKFLEKAAENNDPLALFDLGLLYCDGDLVLKNINFCKNYWIKSAQLGNASANFNLGLLVINNKNEKNQIREAIDYFKKASELGLGAASYNLAIIYSKGLYNMKDDEQAEYYKKIAKEQGYNMNSDN